MQARTGTGTAPCCCCCLLGSCSLACIANSSWYAWSSRRTVAVLHLLLQSVLTGWLSGSRSSTSTTLNHPAALPTTARPLVQPAAHAQHSSGASGELMMRAGLSRSAVRMPALPWRERGDPDCCSSSPGVSVLLTRLSAAPGPRPGPSLQQRGSGDHSINNHPVIRKLEC